METGTEEAINKGWKKGFIIRSIRLGFQELTKIQFWLPKSRHSSTMRRAELDSRLQRWQQPLDSRNLSLFSFRTLSVSGELGFLPPPHPLAKPALAGSQTMYGGDAQHAGARRARQRLQERCWNSRGSECISKLDQVPTEAEDGSDSTI